MALPGIESRSQRARPKDPERAVEDSKYERFLKQFRPERCRFAGLRDVDDTDLLVRAGTGHVWSCSKYSISILSENAERRRTLLSGPIGSGFFTRRTVDRV